MAAETINGWTVTSDSETFRIFPKGADGKTRPITRINQFLYLTNDRNEQIIVKRYLHQGQWFWKISTCEKHKYDLDIRDSLSRLLFPVPGLRDGEGRRLGDREKATDVMIGFMAGRYA